MFINYIPRQASQMVRVCSALVQDGDHIFQRLLHLRHQIIANKLCLCIPANLPGHKEQLPFTQDPI